MSGFGGFGSGSGFGSTPNNNQSTGFGGFGSTAGATGGRSTSILCVWLVQVHRPRAFPHRNSQNIALTSWHPQALAPRIQALALAQQTLLLLEAVSLGILRAAALAPEVRSILPIGSSTPALNRYLNNALLFSSDAPLADPWA